MTVKNFGILFLQFTSYYNCNIVSSKFLQLVLPENNDYIYEPHEIQKEQYLHNWFILIRLFRNSFWIYGIQDKKHICEPIHPLMDHMYIYRI